MFWDFLYRLTARDEQFPQLVFRYAQGSDSGLKTPCTVVFFDVPQDQVFIASHWSITATPAAATAIDKLDFFGLSPTGNPLAIAAYDFLAPGAAVATNRADSRDFVVVPSGWSVRANASFTAATGNNQLSASCSGFFVPRGNLISLV